MTERDKHRLTLLREVIEDAEMDAQNTLQIVDSEDARTLVQSALIKIRGCLVFLTPDK